MDDNNKVPINNENKDEESAPFGGYSFDLIKGIFPLAVLVYLIIGLHWGYWHPGWVVFIVAWVLEVVLVYVRTGKLKISVYGVAALVFIVLGFVFGLWGYAWLAFVAAWVLDEMIVSPKKNKKKKNKKNHSDDEKL